VHGLNGHRETSWRDEASGTMWLEDLLPRRVPTARILTFGYDAETLKLSEVSRLTLNDHATSLIVDLLRVRRDPKVSHGTKFLEIISRSLMYVYGQTEQRPIIFLAHSLGGIVVKHVSASFPLPIS
jgi:hypothetical protein